MKKYLMYISIALLVSGCGEGDSSFSDGLISRSVEVGSEVFVGSGDTVTPDTQDTEIVVSHYLNDTKSVKVLKGSITLVSGNYNVK